MWSKSETEVLLTLYQKWPILYDKKHKDYLNRNKRNFALRHVLNRLKTIKPDVTICDIKNKIKTLRSQYIKGKTKEKSSKKSVASTDQNYETSLWCFDQLQYFHQGSYDARAESSLALQLSSNSCTNLKHKDKNLERYYNSFDEEQESPDQSPEKTDGSSDGTEPFEGLTESNDEPQSKIKKVSAYEVCANIAKSLVDIMKTKNTAPVDTPSFRLGRFVAEELANVPEEIFFDAKWKIMDILRQANFEDMQQKNLRRRTISEVSSSSSELRSLFARTQHCSKIFASTPPEVPSPTYASDDSVSQGRPGFDCTFEENISTPAPEIKKANTSNLQKK